MRARARAVVGGVVAGLAGAVASTPLPLLISLVRGEDLLAQLKQPAFPVLRERALAGGFDLLALVLGGLGHFGVSLAWGLGLSLVVHGGETLLGRRLTLRPALALGAAFGLVVWLVMFHVVLPAVNAKVLARAFSLPRAMTEHVLFGLGAAGGLYWYRWRDRYLASTR